MLTRCCPPFHSSCRRQWAPPSHGCRHPRWLCLCWSRRTGQCPCPQDVCLKRSSLEKPPPPSQNRIPNLSFHIRPSEARVSGYSGATSACGQELDSAQNSEYCRSTIRTDLSDQLTARRNMRSKDAEAEPRFRLKSSQAGHH